MRGEGDPRRAVACETGDELLLDAFPAKWFWSSWRNASFCIFKSSRFSGMGKRGCFCSIISCCDLFSKSLFYGDKKMLLIPTDRWRQVCAWQGKEIMRNIRRKNICIKIRRCDKNKRLRRNPSLISWEPSSIVA